MQLRHHLAAVVASLCIAVLAEGATFLSTEQELPASADGQLGDYEKESAASLSVPLGPRWDALDLERQPKVVNAAAKVGMDGGQASAADEAFVSVEQLRLQYSYNRSDDIMEPCMSLAEREAFYGLLDKAINYLEFGSGGSTVVALQRQNIKRLHTVESSEVWMEILAKRGDVSDAISSGRMSFVHADVGPTKAWGYPSDESSKEAWPKYSGSVAESDSSFDLIFVDGRFRVASILKALRRAPSSKRSSVTFVMHDYTNRPWYHVVEKFLEKAETVDTLQVFKAPTAVDEAALENAIAKYEYIVE